MASKPVKIKFIVQVKIIKIHMAGKMNIKTSQEGRTNKKC